VVRRRRIRRVAAFTLLIVGLANVVFALLWPVRWLRPIGLWLLFEHRHFRVSPPGFRQVVGWVIMTGPAVAALAAGLDAA
jgi:hypothetical protein